MPNVVVVGSGVVGQATGRGFLRHNYDVLFVDVHMPTLERLSADGMNVAEPHELSLKGVDAVFVTVSTPTGDHGVDLSAMHAACMAIGESLASAEDGYPIVAFRSTIPPGTTRSQLIPWLEEVSGLSVGRDFGVCFNPEYLREHCAVEDFARPRIITIGCEQQDTKVSGRMHELYQPFSAPIHVSTYEEAEFHKYVNNLFNANKISFFNEMRLVAEQLGFDPTQAFKLTALSAQGMWDQFYGTQARGAYGGACLPKDSNAWIAYTASRQLPAQMVTAARRINRIYGEN